MTTSRYVLCLLGLCCSVRGVPATPGEQVAVVDGVPITRAQLHQTLEGIYGEQVLPELIDAQLLERALATRGQSVSDAEVNIELARVEVQNASIKTIVELGGARLEVIRRQVRRNLGMQKLLTARVADPTDAQLRSFFSRFALFYGTPVRNKLGILVTSSKVRANQLARALIQNPGRFDSLVAEQKAATDLSAGQSTSDMGQFVTPDEFITLLVPSGEGLLPAPALLVKALRSAQKGQILCVQALSPGGPFLIIKVVDHQSAIKPELAAIQTQVKTDYKMAQVAQAEIRKNPQNPQSLEQNIRQVMDYLSQPNSQTGQPVTKATLRDALTTILRPAANNSLNYLRAHAKITITDPSLKSTGNSQEVGNAAFDPGG